MSYIITQLDILIIEGSMIGLGLVIALYTLVVPLIDSILKQREEELEEKQEDYQREIRKHLRAKFTIKEKDRFQKVLKEKGDDIDRVFYRPANLPILMIISLGLFSIPLLMYFFGYFGFNVEKIKNDMFLIFLFSIIYFVLLVIYIFFKLYVTQLIDFSILVKKLKKQQEKDVKEIKTK